MDSAYWLYYREYYNQVYPGIDGHPGLGDILYDKQGSCMSNIGVDPAGLAD